MKKWINLVGTSFVLTPFIFTSLVTGCKSKEIDLQVISPSDTSIIAETKSDYSAVAIFKNFSYRGDLIPSNITITTTFKIGIAQFTPRINNLDKAKKIFDLCVDIVAAPENYNVEGEIQFYNNGKLIEYNSPVYAINFVPQKTITFPAITEKSTVVKDKTKPVNLIFHGFSSTHIDDFSKLSVRNNFQLLDSKFISSIIPIDSNNFDINISITSPHPSIKPINGNLVFYYDDKLIDSQPRDQFTINLLDMPKIIEIDEQTQMIDMYYDEESYCINGFCKFSGFIAEGIDDWSKITVTSDFAFLDQYEFESEIVDVGESSNTFSIKVKLMSRHMDPTEVPGGVLSSKFKFYYEDTLFYETTYDYHISVVYPIFQKYLNIQKIGDDYCLKGFSDIEIQEENIKKQNAIRIPYFVTLIDVNAFNYEELDDIHKKIIDHIFYLDLSNAFLLSRIKAKAFKNESHITQIGTLPSLLSIIETEAFYGVTINKNLSLPLNLSYIQSRAFANQDDLQKVTFNKKCFTNVDLFANDCDNIFANCNKLSSINLTGYGDNIPEVFKQENNNILSGITTNGKIYVSASSDEILAEWQKYIFGDDANPYMSLTNEWTIENTY